MPARQQAGLTKPVSEPCAAMTLLNLVAKQRSIIPTRRKNLSRRSVIVCRNSVASAAFLLARGRLTGGD